MEIIFLGTSCDYATPTREPVTVLIRIRNRLNILFDCHPSILKQLWRAGADPLDIDVVLISHRHIGHCMGIPFLIWGNFVKGRRRDLVIFIPEDQALNAFIKISMELLPIETERKRQYNIRLITLPSKRGVVTLNDILPEGTNMKLAEQVVVHYAPLLHGYTNEVNMGYAVHFTKSDVKIAYIIDTEPCRNAIDLARGADVLIHDAAFERRALNWAREIKHSTAEDAAKVAKEAGVKILVLTHIHASREGRKDFAHVLLEEAKKIFDGIIIVPNDLDVLDLMAYRCERPHYYKNHQNY